MDVSIEKRKIDVYALVYFFTTVYALICTYNTNTNGIITSFDFYNSAKFSVHSTE
jgi:hypothetical protein